MLGTNLRSSGRADISLTPLIGMILKTSLVKKKKKKGDRGQLYEFCECVCVHSFVSVCVWCKCVPVSVFVVWYKELNPGP